jgi:hypothetical protein
MAVRLSVDPLNCLCSLCVVTQVVERVRACAAIAGGRSTASCLYECNRPCGGRIDLLVKRRAGRTDVPAFCRHMRCAFSRRVATFSARMLRRALISQCVVTALRTNITPSSTANRGRSTLHRPAGYSVLVIESTSFGSLRCDHYGHRHSRLYALMRFDNPETHNCVVEPGSSCAQRSCSIEEPLLHVHCVCFRPYLERGSRVCSGL